MAVRRGRGVVRVVSSLEAMDVMALTTIGATAGDFPDVTFSNQPSRASGWAEIT